MAADDRDGVSALRNGVPPPFAATLAPATGPARPLRPPAGGAESNAAEAVSNEDAKVDGRVDVNATAAAAGVVSATADDDDDVKCGDFGCLRRCADAVAKNGEADDEKDGTVSMSTSSIASD